MKFTLSISLILFLVPLAPTGRALEGGAVLTFPTRVVDESDPRSPTLHLPGLPIPWMKGAPKGVELRSPHLAPLFFSRLPLHGRTSLMVLAKVLSQGETKETCTSHGARADMLLFDVDGNGRFSKSESHRLSWPSKKDKTDACPTCGHASLKGDDRVVTRTLSVGAHKFRIQVHYNRHEMSALLFVHTWNIGKVPLQRGWHQMLYMDRNLNGKVDALDWWLLAGPKDPRLEDRMLNHTRMREGNVPFPFNQGKEIRLMKVDSTGRAEVMVSPAKGGEQAYLKERARRLNRKWALSFSTDDPARRKRLGLEKEDGKVGKEIQWHHSIRPLSLWVKAKKERPLLVWIDEEESTTCRRMEHYTLRDHRVAALLEKKFFLVHVPLGLCPKDPRPDYKLIPLPGLVVVNDQGVTVWRNGGFLTPKKVIKILEDL